MSRASLRRNGPRSGLSRAASEFGLSGGGFLGENLDRDGDGEGGRLGSGEAGLEFETEYTSSDLCWVGVWAWAWVGVPGTEIRSGGVSGGVLTETRPGIFFFFSLDREFGIKERSGKVKVVKFKVQKMINTRERERERERNEGVGIKLRLMV